MYKTTFRFLALLALFSPCRLLIAQTVCGQFSTVPGSTVQYVYQFGTDEFESLPVQANFDISCDDFSLSAVLFSPVIGVDDEGIEVFPTGLNYPLMAELEYNPASNYMGSLQGTQYNAQWTFSQEPGEMVLWNGSVSWFGGRYEETTIENVVLIPVPESSTATLLIAALLVTVGATLRNIERRGWRGASPSGRSAKQRVLTHFCLLH